MKRERIELLQVENSNHLLRNVTHFLSNDAETSVFLVMLLPYQMMINNRSEQSTYELERV